MQMKTLIWNMIQSFQYEGAAMNPTIIEAYRVLGIEVTADNWWSVQDSISEMKVKPEWWTE